MSAFSRSRWWVGLTFGLSLLAAAGSLYQALALHRHQTTLDAHQEMLAALDALARTDAGPEEALALYQRASAQRATLSGTYAALTAAATRGKQFLWVAYLFLFAAATLLGFRRQATPAVAKATPAAQEHLTVDAATRAIAADKLIEHGSVGVAVVDRDGRFVYANRALEQMFGYEAASLQERNLDDLMDPSAASYRPPLRRVAHKTDMGLSTPQAFLRRDGSRCWCRLSMTAFSQAPGYGLAVFEDVTARLSVEALEEREAAFEQTRRHFLAAVNHELRTPLTVILGYAGMLEEEATPTQRAAVEAIDRAGRQLQKSLDALLELANLEEEGTHTVEHEPVDVRHAVTDAIARLQPVARDKQLRLVYEGSPEPILLPADAVALHRIAYHLIDNALKFTRQGFIRARVVDEGTSVQLQVRDTGEGIPADRLDHLFEPFRQGSEGDARRHGGLGLGLAIVRRLVDRAGGTIHVESHEGAGSCFTVTFPRPQATAPRQVAPAKAA